MVFVKVFFIFSHTYDELVVGSNQQIPQPEIEEQVYVNVTKDIASKGATNFGRWVPKSDFFIF